MCCHFAYVIALLADTMFTQCEIHCASDTFTLILSFKKYCLANCEIQLIAKAKFTVNFWIRNVTKTTPVKKVHTLYKSNVAIFQRPTQFQRSKLISIELLEHMLY